MTIVFASRTGNVQKLINKLNITDAVKINDGTEKVNGDYILFTYTTGRGETPKPVADFIANNPGIKAVVGSGNSVRHPDTFNFAAKNISEHYNVPILAKVEGEGSDEDVKNIQSALAEF